MTHVRVLSAKIIEILESGPELKNKTGSSIHYLKKKLYKGPDISSLYLFDTIGLVYISGHCTICSRGMRKMHPSPVARSPTPVLLDDGRQITEDLQMKLA